MRAKLVSLCQTYIQKRSTALQQNGRVQVADLDLSGAAEEICTRLITRTVSMRSADVDLIPSALFAKRFGKTPAEQGVQEVTVGRVTGVLKVATTAQPDWGCFRITSSEAYSAMREQVLLVNFQLST